MEAISRKARARRVGRARDGSACLAGLVTVLAVGMGGCSSFSLPFLDFGSRPVSPPPGDPVPLDRATYVIGPEDQIQVTVWKNPELSVTVPVRPDGRISVPLVDDVQAAGLTTEELKLVLAEKLAEYVKDPEVTVIVSSIQSKRIYLIGGVTSQTSFALNQDMRVLDAIALAGGFTTFANKSKIKILRREGDGLREYRFDYDAFIRGDAPLESNFLLQPGDTIVVPD
jgi:polysaccharide export outer membrane protein